MRWGDMRRSENVEDRGGMAGGVGGGMPLRRRDEDRRRHADRPRDPVARLRHQSAAVPRHGRDRKSRRRRRAARPRSRRRRAGPRRRRRPTSARTSPHASSATPRTCGARCSRRWAATATRPPRSRSTAAPCARAAARRRRPRVRSTAPPTSACTSTRRSSTSSRAASARRATSRRRTSIAHEVGHHVQNAARRRCERFEREGQRLDERRRNALSIRLELQADCYAGVWGHFAQKRNLLEPGDLEEGLRAAAAVGDDTIMKRTQGYVVPDAMNHGTRRAAHALVPRRPASGDPRTCDTFGVAQP